MTACLVKITNANHSLSDGEKLKIAEAIENLNETLNKQNCISPCPDRGVPEAESITTESANQLRCELSTTSEKLDKYTDKLDETHNEIKRLREKLDKIYRTYGSRNTSAVIHSGANGNKQK